MSGRKKRHSKYEYYIHLEPIYECSGCGLVHLRRERKKHVLNEKNVLCIYLCPKCGAKGYTVVGDKEVRRRVKNE